MFKNFDGYGQMQDNNMPLAAQQDFKMAMMQQRVGSLNQPQQPNQQQLMNQRMRPVMPNNNPGLRHLLQQQVSFDE